ncbi:hypothetical protein EDL99_07070 [Ornithobacterium rhinotracheale]|nr:hypothetical protein [Ornithobacterium rhinotracheale]
MWIFAQNKDLVPYPKNVEFQKGNLKIDNLKGFSVSNDSVLILKKYVEIDFSARFKKSSKI